MNEIPKPSWKNTLPFQIPIGLYNLVLYGPSNVKKIFQEAQEKRKKEKERILLEKEEEERLQKLEEIRQKEKENRQLRRRKQAENLPQKTEEELPAYGVSAVKSGISDERGQTRARLGGLWTDEDLAELVRLTKKYPGGTANRWEIIGEALNRSVYDVTHMAAKLKETAFKPGQMESQAEQIIQEAKIKLKTKKVVEANEGIWSQAQQQSLEAAIIKHPKTATYDRWQKISQCVPGKTKEECLKRYKYLVELVKKQKEESEAAALAEKQKETAAQAELEKEDIEETEKIKNHESDDDEIGELIPKSSKGKAKNKRKERKKNAEYVSYEDYENLSESE